MLSLVWERRPTYNNSSTITKSSLTTYAKLCYYAVFAICYGVAGSIANQVMVNSSWTLGHIKFLWRLCAKIDIVFPPCDTSNFEDLPLSPRQNIIISVGQFRPEKDHALQLRSFSIFQEKYGGTDYAKDVKLILLGSCRDKEDQARVDGLYRLASELGISDKVEFVLNQPFLVLKEWLGRASVGLHTMWNEHFGIGVVEMMSAGCITVAHCSGGPRADIVVPLRGQRTGFLASTEEEYADVMSVIFSANEEETLAIRKAARESARRFSVERFKESFQRSLLSSNILVL